MCCLLTACTLLASLELYREKRRAANLSGELAEAVSMMISSLRFESADVFEMCRKCFDNVKSADISRFKSISKDFHDGWNKACDILTADDEVKRLMRSAGAVLGSCDAESQSERLSRICDALSKHSDELKKRTDETKKLYMALGALTGLGISIIII